MSEKLNKLQIRAKVLEIVKSYKYENDINSIKRAQERRQI